MLCTNCININYGKLIHHVKCIGKANGAIIITMGNVDSNTLSYDMEFKDHKKDINADVYTYIVFKNLNSQCILDIGKHVNITYCKIYLNYLQDQKYKIVSSTKENLFQFTPGLSEKNIFKMSIQQNNPNVKNKK